MGGLQRGSGSVARPEELDQVGRSKELSLSTLLRSFCLFLRASGQCSGEALCPYVKKQARSKSNSADCGEGSRRNWGQGGEAGDQ